MANFGEILNYSGDRVEQSSSLLYTLILAALAAFRDSALVTAAKLLTIVGGLLTIWLTGRLAKKVGAPVLASCLLIATAVPLLYWSFGGLETVLVTAVLLLLLANLTVMHKSTGSNTFLLSLGIAAYLTIRPERVFVLGLFYVLIGLFHYRERQVGVSRYRAWFLPSVSSRCSASGGLATSTPSFRNRSWPRSVRTRLAGFLTDTGIF